MKVSVNDLLIKASAMALIAEPDCNASYSDKGIAYLGGLTEGAETILFFVAICLWPAAFPLLAYLFSAAAFVTTVARWIMGWSLFRP